MMPSSLTEIPSVYLGKHFCQFLPGWPPVRYCGVSWKEAKLKVTDTLTWVRCFCTYSAVGGAHDPIALLELMMAYMSTVVRVSQEFKGWLRCGMILDSTSRCQLPTIISGR